MHVEKKILLRGDNIPPTYFSTQTNICTDKQVTFSDNYKECDEKLGMNSMHQVHRIHVNKIQKFREHLTIC